MIDSQRFPSSGRISEAMLFLFAAALYLLSYAVSGSSGAFASLAALCIVLIALYLPLRDPTEPAYILLGVILFYFVPRQLLLILEQLPLMGHLAPAEHSLMRYGNLLVGAGAVAFHVSYRSCKTVRLLPGSPLPDRSSGFTSSLLSALAVSLVALAALAFIVRTSGADLGALQGESQQLLKQGTLGIAYNVFQWLPLCSLLLIYRFSDTRWRGIALVHIILLVVATTILTRREPLIILVFGLMAFYGAKRVVPRLGFSVLSVIVLAVFVLVGYLRVAAQTGGLELVSFLLAYFYVGEFWVYDMFLVILREAGSVAMPWRYGLDITPGFLDNFLPFLKLPDAAIGDQLGDLLNPASISRAGIPPSIFGMLYLNFAESGLILGLLVLGVLAAAIDQWRRWNMTIPGFFLSALAYTWLGYVMRNASPYNSTLFVIKLAIGIFLIILVKSFLEWGHSKSSKSDTLAG